MMMTATVVVVTSMPRRSREKNFSTNAPVGNEIIRPTNIGATEIFLFFGFALTHEGGGARMEMFDRNVIGSRDLTEQLAPRQQS